MSHRTLRTLACALLLLGCAAPGGRPPTPEEIAAADHGPAPVAVKASLPDFVRQRYADRSIVHVSVGEPRQAWYGQLGGLAARRDIRFGWAVGFRGYRLGFTQMESLAVEGEAFYRNGRLEGIHDDNGFEFVQGMQRERGER